MRTVASTYLHSAIQTCVAQGCREDELIAVVPGGEAALSDTLLRLPCKAFYDVLYRAEDLLGQTGIGIHVGQNFRPTTFLHFGYGMVSCATLREAMIFNRKYQPVNQQLGRAQLVVENDSAFVEWESPDKAEYARPAVEAVLTGYVGIGKWITWTHGDEVRSMHFRHSKPAHADLVDEVFECPVYYDAPIDRLEFDAGLVDKPMPASNPALVEQLSKRLDQVLLSMDNPGSVGLSVYRIISENLAEELPTIDYVAGRLGVSERTLRRRLAEENQSFRDLLTEVRKDVCEIYMSEPKKSLVEISQLLGYSEHSAFDRAFRRWFGTTPTAYRERYFS